MWRISPLPKRQLTNFSRLVDEVVKLISKKLHRPLTITRSDKFALLILGMWEILFINHSKCKKRDQLIELEFRNYVKAWDKYVNARSIAASAADAFLPNKLPVPAMRYIFAKMSKDYAAAVKQSGSRKSSSNKDIQTYIEVWSKNMCNHDKNYVRGVNAMIKGIFDRLKKNPSLRDCAMLESFMYKVQIDAPLPGGGKRKQPLPPMIVGIIPQDGIRKSGSHHDNNLHNECSKIWAKTLMHWLVRKISNKDIEAIKTKDEQIGKQIDLMRQIAIYRSDPKKLPEYISLFYAHHAIQKALAAVLPKKTQQQKK